MAKNCVQFAIDVDTGDGWDTVRRFRDTRDGAVERFNKAVEVIPDYMSARLVEVRVLEQHNKSLEILP
jgi:hypothetical protein